MESEHMLTLAETVSTVMMAYYISNNKKEEALNLLGADNFVLSSNEAEMKGLANSLDFIINSASGDIPFDLYLPLLKTAGVLSLVGFRS